jgi:hypothetical protein
MLGSRCSECCCSPKDSNGVGTYFEDFFEYADASAMRNAGWTGAVEVMQMLEPGVLFPYPAYAVENGDISRRTYIEPLVPATIRMEADIENWAPFSPAFVYIYLRVSRGLPDNASLDGHGATALFSADLMPNVEIPLADKLLLEAEFHRQIVAGQPNNEQWTLDAWANGEQVIDSEIIPWANSGAVWRPSITEEAECFTHKIGWQGRQLNPGDIPFVMSRYLMRLTYE